jgi:hypothetical protein
MACPYILVISSEGVKIKIYVNMVTAICTNARLELFYNRWQYIYFCVPWPYGRYVIHIRDRHPTDGLGVRSRDIDEF